MTVAHLAEALESRRVKQLDRSAKITVRHGQSDRYVATWTTENGRLVLLTSTVDMWRGPGERAELVERIIKQDRTIRDLRDTVSSFEDEGEEGVGELIAGLHARIEDLRLEIEALRKRGAA